MSELGSQLVSETGQDILTIPFGETEPVLYRLCCSILLLNGIGIQPHLVPGHIPYHSLILFTVLVTGTILKHLPIAVWSCSLVLTSETGFRIQPHLVPGHIPYHISILITGLVAGTDLEHQGIAVLHCTSAPLALAILEFFLDRSVACYLVLYILAVACLVANALCLPLLPGCHDGSWCKEKNQHCTQCYFLEHVFHSWRVWDD
jgi:hypothetical protein